MTLGDFHEVAQATTPQGVSVPRSWGGLFAWAVGRWGAGAVFLMMLVPVYSDLKASNVRLAEISTANVKALEALTQRVESANAAVDRLAEDMRRLEIKTDAQRSTKP